MSIYYTKNNPEIEAEILADDSVCPFCGSIDLFFTDNHRPDEEIICPECDHSWLVVMRPVAVLFSEGALGFRLEEHGDNPLRQE